MKTEELKPCPICGCRAEFDYGAPMTSGQRIVKVKCSIGCVEQNIFRCNELDAATAWNNRAPVAAPSEGALEAEKPHCTECSDEITAHDPGVCGACLSQHRAPTAAADDVVFKNSPEMNINAACVQSVNTKETTPSEAAPAGQSEGGAGDGPAYGIIDPDYARYYSMIRCTAWQYGYAIGMHGSFTRDLDLIAVPWTDIAVEPERLVQVICGRTDLTQHHKNPTEKPHGRLVFTLMLPGFGDPRWVDLSITPKAALALAAAQPTKEGGEHA